jgi:hypothetical protein
VQVNATKSCGREALGREYLAEVANYQEVGLQRSELTDELGCISINRREDGQGLFGQALEIVSFGCITHRVG